MQDLFIFYTKYEEIRASYQGEKTDWQHKRQQLSTLYSNMPMIKIKSSKYSSMYNYTKRKLSTDIFNEIKRISEIINNKRRLQSENN